MPDLESIYRKTMERCRPETLVRDACHQIDALPRTVVAIGKAAGALLDGVASIHRIEAAMAVVPHGYREPSYREGVVIAHGGHPRIDGTSLYAGDAVTRFVESAGDLLFLISGGGSACVEKPLEPWFTPADLIEVNARLIDSGLPIASINTVRKHLSAIKGGRLGGRVRGRAITLIHSDVSSGAAGDVASGPTTPDTTTNTDAAAILERIGGCDRIVTRLRDEALPETVKRLQRAEWRVIADNATLTEAAAQVAAADGWRVVRYGAQIETGVQTAAADLARRALQLERGEILIAGGEPAVAVRGNGKGGRCMELAVRFAMAMEGHAGFAVLFASSDGVDGNSGAAGAVIDRFPVSVDQASRDALERSDSLTAVARTGRPFIIPPTGNNLRDLYLVARP